MNTGTKNKKVTIEDLIAPKDAWDRLSMSDKADMMGIAVRNGITDLKTIREKYNEFAEGGKAEIHIKPENRGKFTALKERTGHSASWFKEHGTPAQKRMAIFDLNSRHWKHGLGGNLFDGDSEDTQQMEVQRTPHIDLALNNPWLYQKLHPTQRKEERYDPTTFAGRVAQVTGAREATQKFADYTSSVVQQVPIVGLVPSALDLGYDTNRLYNNPSAAGVKDVALDAASLLPALRKTMKGWWVKGNSGQFVTETGQVISNPRVASSLEVALQPYRAAINTGVFAGRAADFIDDSKAFLKDMYNDSPIGKHFPIKANGGPLVDMAMANMYAGGGSAADDDLVDFLIREEGNLPKPTDIGDGKITLGSGLTAQKWHDLYKRRGNRWSAADNRRAVAEEVASRRRWAESNIPNWDRLPASSQKALLSYKYNYDFTPTNSPKLFKALSDFNLFEAARQMDATSKDSKFKRGLVDRRKREQEWFLSGVGIPQAPTEQPVSTAVYNPYRIQAENTTVVPQMVPDEGSYIKAHPLTESELRRQKVQERWDAINRFNSLMELVGFENNPLQQFEPTSPVLQGEYSLGGHLLAL